MDGRCATTLFVNALMVDGQLTDILVADGQIVALSRASAPGGTTTIDLGGRLVLPGFVDGHIHLDKTFLPGPWRPYRPCSGAFDVRERVQIEKRELVTAGPTRLRAKALLERAIAHGSSHVRTHVDINTAMGLSNLEAVVEVAARYDELISVQIVAFPQSGILSDPGTELLLSQALRTGAHLIGGLDPSGFDGDVDEHLNVIFDIAQKFGVGIDIHLHDSGDVGLAEIRAISERTLAAGMNGHVVISHAHCLGEVSDVQVRKAAEVLARAGAAVMTIGAGMYPILPLRTLASMGVTVFTGSDNVRDSWWPYGNADMLERTMLLSYRAGFLTDDDLQFALSMATTVAAKALGVLDYGLEVGKAADFVALKAQCAPEAIMERPKDRLVFKGGRLVAQGNSVIDSRATVRVEL